MTPPMGYSGSRDGVLYVATGAAYYSLTLISLRHLRAVEPHLPVALATDQALAAQAAEHFDHVVVLDSPTFSFDDKIQGMSRTPFARTVFLDSDTIPIAPFAEDLFAGLEYFPLLARSGMSFNSEWETSRFPSCLTQYNTGVVAYRTLESQELWRLWQQERREHPEGHDQPTFRSALLRSGLAVGDLSSAFNYLDSNLIPTPVRIIHCVSFQIEMLDLPSRIRLIEKVRCFRPPALIYKNIAIFEGGRFQPLSLPRMFLYHLQRKARSMIVRLRQRLPRFPLKLR